MKTTLIAFVMLLASLATQGSAMTTSEIDTAWIGIGSQSASLDTRFTYAVMLEAAAADWHPERMAQFISIAGHSMDRNPASAMYGNLGISYGQPVPTDPNVGVFCMADAAVVWQRYRSALSASAQSELRALMLTGVQHILRYAVDPSYTNIYLLKCFDCIALGEALGEPSTATTGYEMLTTVLSYSRTNGIHEFCSPTYYGVDLEALALIEHLAGQPSGRQQARLLEDLLWSDIAANWFAPSERIAGSHGRDHDFLHGFGKSDVELQLAGWLTHRIPTIENFPDASSSYFAFARSTPPTSVNTILARLPRVVHAQWGTLPWQSRTTYISSHVALATSGGSYCAEDKIININLRGASDSVVNACLVMDGIDDPYGTQATPNSVHNVSLQHLTPAIVAKQTGEDALVLVAERLSPGASGSSLLTGVHANFLLPQNVSIWSGGRPVPMPAATARINLSLSQPVYVHCADVVIGLKVVYASGINGAGVSLWLVNDGGALGACRLVVEQGPAGPTTSGNAELALHLTVADGLTSSGFAAFRAAFAATTGTVSQRNGILTVATTTTGNGLLSAGMDLATYQPTVTPGLPAAALPILNVDGTDVGHQVLNGLPVTLN